MPSLYSHIKIKAIDQIMQCSKEQNQSWNGDYQVAMHKHMNHCLMNKKKSVHMLLSACVKANFAKTSFGRRFCHK